MTHGIRVLNDDQLLDVYRTVLRDSNVYDPLFIGMLQQEIEYRKLTYIFVLEQTSDPHDG